MWISEEVDRRLREYIITQMMKLFQFILAVNDIEDSGTKTFDEVCTDEWTYIFPNIIPNYKCLWGFILHTSRKYFRRPYTPILSAYCRSNKINTKKELYIKMSAELESWINTINMFNDIVKIAIGMSQNKDICESFSIYGRISEDDSMMINYYRDILDLLIKNNFENIDPYPDSMQLKPYKTIQIKYDDPHQQVFYKYIMFRLIKKNQYIHITRTRSEICFQLLEIIYNIFYIIISIRPTYAEWDLQLNNIDQIIEYAESKIPQYPSKIKDHLSILTSIDGFHYFPRGYNLSNLSKMAELSNYNLRDLPIEPIIYGEYGATPLEDIPLEKIPEYYARLTHNYSGQRTKAAKRDLAF